MTTPNTSQVSPVNPATSTLNFNGFTSKVDFKNAEHFRRGSVIRLERDYVNQRLIMHVYGIGSLILVRELVSDKNNGLAWFHAFGQRIPDAAAISEEARGGTPKATPRQKFDAMATLVQHYNSGAETWNIERDAAVGADTILVEALLLEPPGKDKDGNAKPERTREKVIAYVNGLTKGQKDKMLFSDRLDKYVKKVRAERNAEVDEDKLFADLDF